MPHDGLMDEEALGPVEGPRQRARLHIRSGCRRLRQGKISAGIATLYDAVEGALLSHAQKPEVKAMLRLKPDENINDTSVLYNALVRSGLLDDSFDFHEFDGLTERALHEEFPVDFDYRPLQKSMEDLMAKLGVMPFDEQNLPPEDPSTF